MKRPCAVSQKQWVMIMWQIVTLDNWLRERYPFSGMGFCLSGHVCAVILIACIVQMHLGMPGIVRTNTISIRVYADKYGNLTSICLQLYASMSGWILRFIYFFKEFYLDANPRTPCR